MKQKILQKIHGIIALLAISIMTVNAQSLIGPTNPGTTLGTSSTDGSTIFVYGNSSFTLTANTSGTIEGGTDLVTFTSFAWNIKNAAGGYDGITSLSSGTASAGGTANSVLTVSDLSPGYYTFMAQGSITGNSCLPDPTEFTVFVLRPVSLALSLEGTTLTEYCATDMPANMAIKAEASYSTLPAHAWNTQTDKTAPDLTAFELTYSWYKSASATFDIATATSISTSTPATGSTSNTYTFNNTNDGATGAWYYHCVVGYTVKTFQSSAAVLGGGTPTVITVSPKPGKPTITISSTP